MDAKANEVESLLDGLTIEQQQELIDILQAKLDANRAESSEYDHRQDLHGWFGLSYSTFIVIPRVATQLMPDNWQMRLAELLHQYDETINTGAFGVKGCTVRALGANGKLMKTPEELLNYRHPTPETKAELLRK